jgi:predicted nucleotidyltransferase
MARKNHREYLKGERVRLKKYLYVLRPLLACLWVEQRGGVPPMRFQALVDGLVSDPALQQAIAELLRIKRAAGEAQHGRPMPVLGAFIEQELARLERAAPPVPRGVDFTVLDELLAHTVLRLSGPAALAAGDMAQG